MRSGTRRRLPWWALCPPLLLIALAGLYLLVQPAPTRTTESPPASAAAAVERLGQLEVQPRPTDNAGYDRDLYGGSWQLRDADGCNQRDVVLARDAEPGSLQFGFDGSCERDVRAGTWTDPYSGITLTLTDLTESSQAQAIQIDHVVSLAEAHRSGGHAWSAQRREQFANDALNLLAVAGPENGRKSDLDPAEWQPRPAFRCEYARIVVTVKHTWELTVDDAEVTALREQLATCPG